MVDLAFPFYFGLNSEVGLVDGCLANYVCGKRKKVKELTVEPWRGERVIVGIMLRCVENEELFL